METPLKDKLIIAVLVAMMFPAIYMSVKRIADADAIPLFVFVSLISIIIMVLLNRKIR